MVYSVHEFLVTPANSGLHQSDLGDVTSNCLQSGFCTIDLTDGWKLELENPGEKVLATPLTITGKVFFTSYMPFSGTGATACSPSEGAGRLYAVSLSDARAVINYDSSDDDASNPDAPSTKSDRSVELQSMGIPAEVVAVPRTRFCVRTCRSTISMRRPAGGRSGACRKTPISE